MKTYEGVEVYLHHSWLRHQIEVSGQLHTPVALPPGERTPGTHWIRGRVGSKSGLDAKE
jgi:hypothetical protein